MAETNNDLDELSREIRRIISDNKKFLDKVMDDKFEPEEEISGDSGPDEEEAGQLVEL